MFLLLYVGVKIDAVRRGKNICWGGGGYSRIGCREGAYVENIYISRTFFFGVIVYLASCDNV